MTALEDIPRTIEVVNSAQRVLGWVDTCIFGAVMVETPGYLPLSDDISIDSEARILPY